MTGDGGAGAGGGTPALLAEGTLSLHGRIPDASNAVLYGTVERGGERLPCVYKPVRGERPLWDFPDGSLARREVAAYEVCRATGWELIPPTVLRDGPYGEGMCQVWVGPAPHADEDPGGQDAEGGEDDEEPLLALVEGDEPGAGWKAVGFADVGGGRTALLVHADDERLRRLAVLDAVINNGDRKGGHLLRVPGGRLYAIDHGVTFHADDKLRTLLWGWAGEELTGEAVAVLHELTADLAEGAPLAARLSGLLTGPEVEAVRKRAGAMLSSGRHPLPSGDWPAIPWPPV
ncbi:SCO1664 family protein [Streptomyces boncukensis]|uniref:SCO1664 family protein n=1 Tax=Streptomyces boncukensis TaxID=2711219 RepID=A0A6G4WRB4_9ACTN|nr:SCO1664 family protein [Streptomyces boncukensis]NGO67819.1 SCO1664 family protein [Streptomyces boncukensis]